MALRIYLAGTAQSDHGDNWRGELTSQAFVDGDLDDLLYNKSLFFPEWMIIKPAALKGGFDLCGAYIYPKQHYVYDTSIESLVELHRQSLELADVIWAWLPGCGAGTWSEIGYATGLSKPIVFASMNDPRECFGGEAFSFTFAFGKQPIIAPSAVAAWDKFISAPMKYMAYQDYLNTRHWERTKAALYTRQAKQCARCGSLVSVQVHHLSYDRVGREELSDLEPLCASCHALEHNIEVAL